MILSAMDGGMIGLFLQQTIVHIFLQNLNYKDMILIMSLYVLMQDCKIQ